MTLSSSAFHELVGRFHGPPPPLSLTTTTVSTPQQPLHHRHLPRGLRPVG
ncbi:hypothetical protein Hanom_Chr05g00434111 [Helianthus anomalus]